MSEDDCTGLTALWCPLHGCCACPGDPDPYADGDLHRSLDDPSCPLHSLTSRHADPNGGAA